MLSSRKIRRSGRLAKMPRVNYSKFFFAKEDASDDSAQEGSVSTFATYNIQDTPKSVLKQINTVKKMRLESGSAAAVTEVRRSARIAAKLQDEVNDIANILMSMKITPKEIGASTNTLFTEQERPPFLEPITTGTNNTVVVDMEALNTQLAALLNNIATTKDLYGDIIKVAEMITAYPELVAEDESRSSLRLVGRAISVRFLADEDALKSARSNDISNAISLLLSL